MQHRFRMAQLSPLIGLLFVVNVSAAESAVDLELSNLPIEQLMQFEIESATKHAQKVSDVPAVVSIVTADDIKTYGYRTLSDVLNSIRGLYVSYDRNYSYLGVRGFGIAGDYNTRVLMLVDGVRYNDSIYDQALIGTEFNIDIDLIDRVEFISGPASSVYGSNALFGVINIITKNGADFKGANVAVDVESYHTAKGRMTFGDTAANGSSWLLSLTRYSQHGQDLYYPEYDTPDQNNGVAKAADYDRSTSFLAKYKQDNLSVTLTQGERIKGIPTASFGQAFNDSQSQTIDTRSNIGVDYKHTFDQSLMFTGRLYGGRYVYQGDYVYSAPTVVVNRDQGYADWMGGEAQLNRAFNRHNIVWGIEYRYDSRLDQLNYNIAPYASNIDDRRSANSESMYVQDEYALNDQIFFDLGLRFDHSSMIDWTTSPRIGVIYKLTPKTTLKALHGTAFRSPNTYEMYYYQQYYQSTLGSSYHFEPEIKEEHLTSTELIIEQALNASQRVGFSVFQNDVKDLIALMANPDGSLFFDNVSGATTKGVELEWQAAWSTGVRVKTSYSRQQTRDSETGREIANTPHNLIKLNLAGPIWNDRWSYGLDLRGVSTRKTLKAEVPGYALTDLTVRMQWTPQCELSASAYNVFDQRYYDPGSAEHVQDSLQQNGRNFRLKIDYWL